VAAHGVPAVPLAEHRPQPVGLAQPGGGAEHGADGDRAPEHRRGFPAHLVVAQGDEFVVPGEICGQSVSSALAASAGRAAMAASTW